MEPIVNWVGNKAREADLLLSLFPLDFQNYYEPFVGSGAVFLKVEARQFFINDRCKELAELYRAIKGNRELFYNYLECFANAWTNIDREYFLQSDYLISAYKAFRVEQTSYTDMVLEVESLVGRIRYDNVFSIKFTRDEYAFNLEKRFQVVRKFICMNKDERTGGEYDDGKILRKIRTGMKAAIFSFLQNLYNRHTSLDDLRVALFYFLMMYNASGAYLLDKRHEFSIPYAGEKYNDKRIESKYKSLQEKLLREKLLKTYIGGSDYRTFLRRTRPGKEDFLFLDPPETGNYIQNGGWEFTYEGYRKLLNYLDNECSSRWLMVVRNEEKLREMIISRPNRIAAYSKYDLRLMDMEDESATHLLICNY